MSHCGYKAPDAAVAGGNLTGLRRNMYGQNQLSSLAGHGESARGFIDDQPEKRNKIVAFREQRPSRSCEGWRDPNNLLHKHTHTLHTVWSHLPPDGEKSRALCHIHLSFSVRVRVLVHEMDKQTAGLDNTVMNTHRLRWGSVFKCASPSSPHSGSNNAHFTCRIHKSQD